MRNGGRPCPTRCAGRCCATSASTAPPAPPPWPRRSARAPAPTSYHLRVLADAGVIEEVPGQTNGRERWWRAVLVDLREPDYDSLSATGPGGAGRMARQPDPGRARPGQPLRPRGPQARHLGQVLRARAATTPLRISTRSSTTTWPCCSSTATPPRTPRPGRGPCSSACSTSLTSRPKRKNPRNPRNPVRNGPRLRLASVTVLTLFPAVFKKCAPDPPATGGAGQKV